MKRILVPCDFTQPSQEAYKFAVSLGALSEGEIFVLNVLDLPMVSESALGVPEYAYSPELLTDLKAEAKKNFDKLSSAKSGTVVNFACIHGPVMATIRQFIADKEIDLVVMGTHGSRGWEEFFIGSNTEKIVRSSAVPVFAIRKFQDPATIRNIVFPSTLDLNQTDLMERVKELQKVFHARLHVLLVDTPKHAGHDREEMGAFENFAKHYKLSDHTVNVREDAYEQDGILHFVEEIKADMIAMGTHSRRGLAHLFSGSIAEEILHHSNYLLWTYTMKHKKK
jgi:nucleotide-binding universal stress UspA family protein